MGRCGTAHIGCLWQGPTAATTCAHPSKACTHKHNHREQASKLLLPLRHGATSGSARAGRVATAAVLPVALTSLVSKLVLTAMSLSTCSSSPAAVTKASLVTAKPVLDVAVMESTTTDTLLEGLASRASNWAWVTDLCTTQAVEALCPGGTTVLEAHPAEAVLPVLARVKPARPTVPVFCTVTWQSMVPVCRAAGRVHWMRGGTATLQSCRPRSCSSPCGMRIPCAAETRPSERAWKGDLPEVCSHCRACMGCTRCIRLQRLPAARCPN